MQREEGSTPAVSGRDALARIARRWVELGWQRGDADGVLALYAPDFVDLGNPSGRPGTAAENVAGIRDLYAAFPDFDTTIADLIIDEAAGGGRDPLDGDRHAARPILRSRADRAADHLRRDRGRCACATG